MTRQKQRLKEKLIGQDQRWDLDGTWLDFKHGKGVSQLPPAGGSQEANFGALLSLGEAQNDVAGKKKKIPVKLWPEDKF